jgi:hypothetical protein
MKIRVKVGTMPATYANAVRLRKPPVKGQRIVLKALYNTDIGMFGQRFRVQIDEARDMGGGELLYFVSRR